MCIMLGAWPAPVSGAFAGPMWCILCVSPRAQCTEATVLCWKNWFLPEKLYCPQDLRWGISALPHTAQEGRPGEVQCNTHTCLFYKSSYFITRFAVKADTAVMTILHLFVVTYCFTREMLPCIYVRERHSWNHLLETWGLKPLPSQELQKHRGSCQVHQRVTSGSARRKVNGARLAGPVAAWASPHVPTPRP